jgi:hypothetical protein
VTKGIFDTRSGSGYDDEIVERYQFPQQYLAIPVGGSVLFSHGFSTTGEVGLFGAKTNGNFDCEGATLNNPRGATIYASKARFGANVFFRNGFTTLGEIRLLRVPVECDHGFRWKMITQSGGT